MEAAVEVRRPGLRIAVVSNTAWYLFNFRLNLMHALNAAGHTMLAVAANILSFGTSYIPKRTKPAKPVVNPDNAWTIPEHIGSRKLESDRLPDQLMEYLESYRA